jgi:hypothetical protein
VVTDYDQHVAFSALGGNPDAAGVVGVGVVDGVGQRFVGGQHQFFHRVSV